MIRFIKKLSFFLLLLSYPIFAQSIENTFFKISIPQGTDTKVFESTHEELANIDSYIFLANDKPKYILFMMSNKLLDTAVPITFENFKDFIFDMGNINILKTDKFNEFVKACYNYEDRPAVKGVLYINAKGNILNRFVIMYPDEAYLKSFNDEVDSIIKSIIYKKSIWN